jgi:polyphosphate kinase 2 (PPK2 family)
MKTEKHRYQEFLEQAGRFGNGNGHTEQRKLKSKRYRKELKRLQIELVKLQEWIKHKGLKVVVLFEGRDAAGKGGTIKRVIQRMNPRICRSVRPPKDMSGRPSPTRPSCRITITETPAISIPFFCFLPSG